ncbi:hypothetical protein HLH34_13345 [Gluconacetobacter azotocaptans]|uniref:Proteophosphoglycan 5 n=1 Tax=Gluconacetobacter azotocaptans TaxID=142834 RepID=A0A7W4PET8_9PROT|nr:hypothetical protein [Gluconacetobacter azotocaptans]MBB2190935.1 hypothetical protein [Gluconacetobacter azotocaptans]MBM9401708.1 hypothetical protein [Gluconacetobacter azotocaptans]GBQ31793.1 hypothetical protein AA13594_2189 [Gluconacetobacter azotocaptans DSM 13594]
MKLSFGAILVATAIVSTAPALVAAPPAHAARHKHHMAKGTEKKSQVSATEDLNAKSLAAARAGTTTPTAPSMESPSSMTPPAVVPSGTGVTTPPTAPSPSMPGNAPDGN